jgi:hypothetical protein
MEYGGEPGFSTKFFIVPSEGFQSILDTIKHQGIDDFLVFPCQVPELLGKGEGDQVVFGRESLVQLIFDPLLVFMVLAMGAVSMTTGVGNISYFVAVVIGALRQHVRAMLLPALLHGPEGLLVTGQDRIIVLHQKTMLEFVDYRGDQNHLTPPQLMLKVSARELTA